MIAIIESIGNIKSITHALDFLKTDYIVTAHADDLAHANKLILPGVGHFKEALTRLKQSGLMECIRNEVLVNKKPILGICLGMQLFFDKSYEDGEHEGFGFIPGVVHALNDRPCQLPIPHMGWNDIWVKPSKLLCGIPTGECFYFVHSYAVQCDAKYVCGTTQYGEEIVAAIEDGNIYGTQFHPEKSQASGIEILRNFATLC